MDRVWNFFFRGFRHFAGTVVVGLVLALIFAPQLVQTGMFWVTRRISYGVHQAILRPVLTTPGFIEALVQLGLIVLAAIWLYRRMAGRR